MTRAEMERHLEVRGLRKSLVDAILEVARSLPVTMEYVLDAACDASIGEFERMVGMPRDSCDKLKRAIEAARILR